MWVKVCGLTSVQNALEVCHAGVDAIGLNFYSGSKRFVSPEVAKSIVAALPDNVEAVGLFVNHAIEEIHQIVAKTGISIVQLHGDETPDFAAQLNGVRIIRAFRLDEYNANVLQSEIDAYRDQDIDLFGCLIDAKVDGSYGGTGHTAPWEIINTCYNKEEWARLILAGGLTPANARNAVRSVRPWGVDTASGVESAPGIKDPESVRKFVEAAHNNA